MKKSDELKQERDGLVNAQTTLTTTVEARTENSDFTEDEATQFDTRDAEIKALDVKIKRAEAIEENARRAAAASTNGQSFGKGEAREMDKAMKRYSIHKAIRGGLKNHDLDGVELEMHQEMSKRAKDSGVIISGIAIPSELRADGQTVTQDSGNYGANLVPENLQAPIDFLRPQPVVASMGAQMLTGLSGNIAFPTNDGGISAAWEGEIDPTAKTKTAYGKKTMSPNRLASTVVVSLQNLLQSSIDLERYTINEINAVIGNVLDTAAINGTGTGQPLGVLNTSGINTLTGATNGIAPDWAQLVEMETATFVANANSAMMKYLFTNGTRGFLKRTAHAANNGGYLMGTDNQVNGYGVTTSNLVPSDLTKGSGTNLHAAIFGDWSQLLIGQWGFYDLDVFKDAQVGNVNITVNSFFDVLVKQAKAFTVSKDFIIS